MMSCEARTQDFPTKRSVLALYLSLCVFRIISALFIESQFDPDEYWQTLEPAYCEAFSDRRCAYTWEWTRRANEETVWWMKPFEGPLRSYLSVLPSYMLYKFARKWRWDMLWMGIVPKGPLVLNAILVAAPTDIAVWFMGQWVGYASSSDIKNVKVRRMLSYCCLLCSVTSWFNGYALIRTYSNSVEAMLLAVSLALVSPELFGNTSQPKPNIRTAVAFVLGGMSVAVRFTSLAAFIPVAILLALKNTTCVMRVKFLVVPCALFGFFGIGLSLLVDRYFYGFWTVPFFGSLHFNVILGLGSLYGTHPFHWYLSAGIPAVTGTMLPFVLNDFWTLWTVVSSAAQRNSWIIIASYTILHSMSAHKEFRFLLPILPLFCVRAGHVIHNKMMSSRRHRLFVVASLVLPNLLALVYLGKFHQGAPIQINQCIRQLLAHGSKKRYSVHYLMGCHSTPLYSHLHVPTVEVDAWTLDCSPECRASPNLDCESDLFSKAPAWFVDSVYGLVDFETGECPSNDQENYCSRTRRKVPDLLAVYSEEALVLKSRFESMGLKEVDRFAHGINGLKVGSFQFGDDFSSDFFRHVMLFGVVEFSLEDMVLFANPELLQYHDSK